MRPPTCEVTSLQAVLSWATVVSRAWEEEHSQRPRSREAWVSPWFRGISSVNHSLLPSLYRRNVPRRHRDPILGEIILRQSFARRSLPYHDGRTGRLTSPHALYFAMQHYGMPTRLLDWTTSVAVATYFAVRSILNGGVSPRPVAIWMLHPLLFNYITAEVQYRVLSVEHDIFKNYLPNSSPEANIRPVPEPPIAVVPTSPTERVAVQRGMFTVHGSMQLGIEDYEHCERYLRRAIIPGTAVGSVIQDLHVYGLDETTVFPDLDGLAREMSWQIANSGD